MRQTENLHIHETVPLSPPEALKREFAMDEAANATVVEGREAVKRILRRQDPRLLVIMGPCSVHDPEAALDYARRLKEQHDKYRDRLFILMRVYFEKPRTTVGWKGLISDPHLDDSCDMQTGLKMARKLLLDVNRLGLPAATELLDPIVPQYIADLVSWAAIGARTTESQTHRQMASGLSMPVGFKNGTDGNVQIAIDALLSSRNPHSFLGIDGQGQTCIVKTLGNPYGHVVLRGGRARPNYDPESIAEASEQLIKAGLDDRMVVDCSHANSGKRFEGQELVWNQVLGHKEKARETIAGMMVESNLHEGSQKLTADLKQLRYGVSITDECVGWDTTARMLENAYRALG